MKKILTIALVLVMALGVAAPALAYTQNIAPATGVSPYTVDVYLVEHTTNGNWLSGWITMPPTDRGYAKNEIVAAIGLLNVPAGCDVYADWYRQLRFAPSNVTFNVTDNSLTLLTFDRTWGGVRYEGSATNQILTLNLPTTVGAVAWPAGAGGVATVVSWHWVRDAESGNVTYALQAVPVAGSAFPAVANGYPAAAAGSTAERTGYIPVNSSSSATYRWLIFGKVTDDNAKITFGLRRNAGFVDLAAGGWNQVASAGGQLPNTIISRTPQGVSRLASMLRLNSDYLVGRTVNNATGANTYLIYANNDGLGWNWNANTLSWVQTSLPGDLLFAIETGTGGRTQRLYMYPNGVNGTEYRIHVEPSTNELVFVITANAPANAKLNDQIKITATGYKALRAFYDEFFETGLGFTAYNEGNLLNRGDWTSIAAAAWDISETVDIEPWTPYVTVPDNIVVDPPKTGDVSLFGFVLIALAAAAAVVVKKVRA